MQRMISFIFLMFVFTLGYLFAGSGEIDQEGFTVNGAAGSIVVNGNSYTQIRLMPEVTFGKIGIGLDIDILIDSDGNVREEDWDDAEDYVNKILYVRYGNRGDSFYGKVGSFTEYSLSRLVMNGYTNMLRYPEYRQIGLMLGGSLPFMNSTVEAFSSNVYRNEILAGRVTVVPMSVSEIPLLSKLRVGGTLATDRNQVKGLEDSDNDDYADVFDDYPNDDDWHNEVDLEIEYWRQIYTEIAENLGQEYTVEGFEEWFYGTLLLHRNPSFKELGEESVTVFGLDYDLPLIEGDKFSLGHYAEFAQIVDYGAGIIFPGFYSKFMIFSANLEFRIYGEEFEPNYFDQLYDQNRVEAYKYETEDSTYVVVITKEETLKDNKEAKGWYGSLTTDLKLVTLTVSYEDMYGDDIENGKSIWGIAALKPNLIPKISIAQITYSQTRVKYILEELKTPTTLITGKAGYSLADNLTLVARYSERYKDLNGDAEIKGENETIKTFGFGIEFTF